MLRFPNFSDEWTQTTLGEVAEIRKGVGISKEQLSQDGTPIILYGELYTIYKSEIIRSILSRTEVENKTFYISKGGEVIIPSSGETAWDIATARCVTLKGVILGGDLNIIIPRTDNGIFISYLLNGVLKLRIAQVAQGSSVIHLYGKELVSLPLSLPSLAEQKKIADFLSLIDERIMQQKKSIEERKTIKKALLNKIFSQTIRFPQFSDEWTQITLGEVAEIYQPKTISSLDLIDEGFDVYGANGIIGKYHSYNHENSQILGKVNHT